MKYYIIGVLINILFLLLICTTSDTKIDTSFWRQSDAAEYVAYAKGFIETGTFYDQTPNQYIASTDGCPGYRRTIGYPFFLSVFMWIFGKNWLIAIQLFNCLFFALLYLIIPAIIYEVLGKRKSKHIFWILLLTGIVFARTQQILNNTFFAVMFFGSLWVGIKAIKYNTWWLYFLYVILMSLTATIRLNLSWYFIFNILLFLYFKTDKRIMIITSLILIFTCNFNSFRNLYNHKVFISSNIPQLSIQEYWENDVYEKGIIKTIIHNTKNVFLDNHIVNNVANQYGYNWKEFKIFKQSNTAKIFYILYSIFYLLFWLSILMVIYILLIEKQWLLLLMIGYFVLFWLGPSLLIGTGGSRLRIEFELFMIIIGIGYNYNIDNKTIN